VRKEAETSSRIGIERRCHEDLAAGGRLSVEQKQALGVCYWQVSLSTVLRFDYNFLILPTNHHPSTQLTFKHTANAVCWLPHPGTDA
jgi:hypothetical protein